LSVELIVPGEVSQFPWSSMMARLWMRSIAFFRASSRVLSLAIVAGSAPSISSRLTTPTTPESRRSRLSSACCVSERATFAISASAPLSTASRAAHSRQPLTPRMATQVSATNAAARSGRRLHPALWVTALMQQNSPKIGNSAASVIEL
jgi:hypothetical protein